MDEVKTNIKNIAKIINPAINDIEKLDVIVGMVIDKALIYTGRDYLVPQYEIDLATEDFVFNSSYTYPIPRILYNTLADMVVSVYKGIEARNEAESGKMNSLSDNGQSVSYSDQVQSFMFTQTDVELFGGATNILDRYRLARAL